MYVFLIREQLDLMRILFFMLFRSSSGWLMVIQLAFLMFLRMQESITFGPENFKTCKIQNIVRNMVYIYYSIPWKNCIVDVAYEVI
jgi:hypothetical protein